MHITFQNKPITLKGSPALVGDMMPSFLLKTNSLEDLTLENLTKATLFIIVPSVDTGVCDMELKKFSAQLVGFSNIKAYGVSMDLPFAQSRWCGVNDANTIELVSDYYDHSFSINTGTYIESLGLTTRAIILVDANKKIVYTQFCPEVTDHPDYDAVIAAVKTLS